MTDKENADIPLSKKIAIVWLCVIFGGIVLALLVGLCMAFYEHPVQTFNLMFILALVASMFWALERVFGHDD